MASYTQFILPAVPSYLDTKPYSAKQDRQWFQDLASPGVVDLGDFAVSWVSGLTIQVAPGVAWVLGRNVSQQGTYHCRLQSAQNITVPVNTSANPRLDQVILRILDAASDLNAGNIYEGRIEVVPGVATAGATLTNRNGAADLEALLEASKSYILLADLLVPAGSGNLSAGAIGDHRPFFGTRSSALLTPTLFGQILAPVDGQIVVMQVDATNGINWRMRYDAASSSAYKWEFLGGAEMDAIVDAAEAFADTAAYVDPTTAGPSLVAPRAGIYDITYSASVAISVTDVQAFISPSLGAAAAQDNDAVRTATTPNANGRYVGAMRTIRRTLAIGDTVQMRYKRSGTAGGGPSASQRRLSMKPVRIS